MSKLKWFFGILLIVFVAGGVAGFLGGIRYMNHAHSDGHRTYEAVNKKAKDAIVQIAKNNGMSEFWSMQFPKNGPTHQTVFFGGTVIMTIDDFAHPAPTALQLSQRPEAWDTQFPSATTLMMVNKDPLQAATWAKDNLEEIGFYADKIIDLHDLYPAIPAGAIYILRTTACKGDWNLGFRLPDFIPGSDKDMKSIGYTPE